ncbi:VC0807 family protein [Nocardia terpenica]|uniref:VC0807 family protein n=1 Tax=Nocardia terpenica TaxID=455432 RepID=UPI0012E8321D|nr:VC0807 family protein [Nocardia terpenica]NQE91412.1 hypothetical protein [Nocardia terpenica]
MNTSIPVPETRGHASPPDPRRAVLANILINVVAPVALYYGLRAAGFDQWLALFLGIVPPAVRAIWSVVTLRRVDMLGVLTLSILALVVGVSFLTGSPRFMLAKDGGITAIVGLGFCATLLRTPAYFQLSRAMTRGGDPRADRDRLAAIPDLPAVHAHRDRDLGDRIGARCRRAGGVRVYAASGYGSVAQRAAVHRGDRGAGGGQPCGRAQFARARPDRRRDRTGVNP